ncbi:MAG: alpha/beta hydrolase [Rhodospirillales bacterium]|mgnify:CR=1 FL=1|jgi:acetyl esterase|nr:alpha/beta hydrolase [Rhodospirillales bacterium]MBT4040957.1 alpha/beta hydrolase [Rhodospirillales bacterium]MBT4625641.1 alpha/beta hydrolase [Rhodospirillales bacterium]MBT5350190.1 alpha/beta hydrolase [Rhodospirillales bacterium]MBT5522028.1 alpha/beta hydrolase [Rhodospirillales bacterium]
MAKYNLDPEMQAFVDKCLNFFDEDSAFQSGEEQRSRYTALCKEFDKPHPAGLSITNDTVPGNGFDIPIRIYQPEGPPRMGCLIFFHGGGWVVGDLDSHDSVTAEIAHRAGVTVIAVDYRMAPEIVYPVGHEDCWCVVEAVAGNPDKYGIDPDRIGVGGDSAGAHVSAGLARRARDKGGPKIAAQILMYGAFGGDGSLPSYTECSDAPLLSTADIDEYHKFYWPDGRMPDDALAAPLAAEDMTGLPPAFVQAAEYDPVRDDSVEYARRLEAAGVDVELIVESGLVHSFLRARHVSNRAGDAFTRVCDATKRLLAE